MNNAANSKTPASSSTFDLFRISKAKAAVDLAPNTLRAYARQGLRSYRRGKVVFFSKRELDAFIRCQVTS